MHRCRVWLYIPSANPQTSNLLNDLFDVVPQDYLQRLGNGRGVPGFGFSDDSHVLATILNKFEPLLMILGQTDCLSLRHCDVGANVISETSNIELSDISRQGTCLLLHQRTCSLTGRDRCLLLRLDKCLLLRQDRCPLSKHDRCLSAETRQT